MQEAEKESVIYNLCKKIPIKYGKGMNPFYDGKYCGPTDMSEISFSYYRHVSEIYNVVSFEYQLFQFRIEKKEK